MARRLSPTAYHYAFVAPALLLSIVIVLGPGLLTFAVAFTDWDGLSQPLYAGLRNFAELFDDQVFWAAVVNNAQWALIFLTIPMAIALVVASLLFDRYNKIDEGEEVTGLPTLIRILGLGGDVLKWCRDLLGPTYK